MNLIQSVLNAVLGAGVLSVSEVDKDILYMSVLVFFYFVYVALRSMSRFFLNLSNKI